MKKLLLTAILATIALSTALAAWAGRPATWAQPVALEGVPNLHRVSPALYRSAQPGAVGFKNLGTLGIRTVINLRTFHSDDKLLRGARLGYRSIHMQAWHPDREEAVRFLRIVADTSKSPVLVHCQHGADRTGTMCAVYRVAVQGWTKEEAIREMTQGGFNYHTIWKNLPKWLARLDVARVRREAGIAPPKTEADTAAIKNPIPPEGTGKGK